jgi:hypothetical protein
MQELPQQEEDRVVSRDPVFYVYVALGVMSHVSQLEHLELTWLFGCCDNEVIAFIEALPDFHHQKPKIVHNN